MKIGLVRRGYSPTGGAEAYLLRLTGALVRAGHEVLLFSDRSWPEEALARPGVKFGQVAWPVNGARQFADVFRRLAPERGCDFILSLERVWECDAYRAGDGVHAEWLDIRARYEPRWRSFFRGFQPKHREILALERSLFTGGAGRVIANSQMVKKQIVARFGYPSERIEVVHNGVPPLPLPPGSREEMRRELGLANDAYVLLFAGSGWDRKGLRFAIDAVNASRSQPSLLVAGRGKLGSLPHSDRVRYLGPVSEMSRAFATADAFILPTLYEPFSNACLEALAVGLPVLTTGHNGFAEIIERGVEGEVFSDPRDIAKIAAAIDAWADPKRRGAIRPRLLENAARFSIEENVRSTLAIIEKSRETVRTA